MLCRKTFFSAAVFVYCFFVAVTSALATNIIVTSTRDDPDPPRITLREAIAQADFNDLITFDQTLNGQTIRLSVARGSLIVNKTLTISASKLSSGITIDGNRSGGGNFSVFQTTAATTVDMINLTVTGGNSTDAGGGIATERTSPANSATLNLTDCRIQGNHADFYGGGLAPGGHFSLLRTSVTNNDSNDGGGGIFALALSGFGMTASITDCNISNNQARISNGGACVAYETVTISGTTFNNNNASTGSTGGYSHGGTVTFTNCTFTNNRARTSGGALTQGAGRQEWTLNDCLFAENISETGGGAIDSFQPVSFTANNCLFQENSSPYEGSAIYLRTQLGKVPITFNNCTFERNRNTAAVSCEARNNEPVFENCTFADNDAAAIYTYSTFYDHKLRLNNCTFTANGIRRNQPSISHSNGQLTLDHCRILNGNAGIRSSAATLIVRWSTIANNHAQGPAYVGIAAFGNEQHPGILKIEHSTISGNQAPSGDPGIHISGVMDAAIRNSTISGNSTSTGGFSGGVVLRESFKAKQTYLKLHACTITNNTGGTIAGSAGGLYIAPSPTAVCEVSGCVIADNHHNLNLSQDVSGAVLSSGHNVIGQIDGSSGWTDSDQTGDSSSPLDAQLSPLTDNGGPTLTHALLPKSPARDLGDPQLVGRPDQRGIPRDKAPDAGSYERK